MMAIPPRSEAASLRRASSRVALGGLMPAVLAAAGVTALGLGLHGPKTIAATGGSTAADSDGDGLIDVQEEILGTYLDRADSDDDGFTDLEEIARASDPLDELSIPGSADLSIGLTARAENGVVTMVAPIYARSGSFANIDLEIGVVFNDGTRYELQPSLYLPVLHGGVYSPQTPGFRVVLLEMPFPPNLVQGLGSLSLYGTVQDPDASSGASAAAINLVDFSGVTVAAQNAPWNVQGGSGVIYSPLVPDEEIPASWSSGEICWQQASPVGMVGSSTAYEVSKGICTTSDTYCSSNDCKSKVGTSVLLTDPATLLGG